ncbi:BBS9 protein [Gonium pectorale]|uniref:BBS9 protein n=1 Tax=Gonium pectorale TaxID=33097 RepID=A0A150FVX5_GONPE|nr:BBS9 protein [Gonium pectorale]|eukprot:KXZ41737.1 BBS9 protein [Gonium pectorale]
MSLFKARDWWSTQCGHGEEFDMGCLLVANVDNDPSGQAKIVTGSFGGFLRIYLPRDRGYRPEDLLLESELEGGPILALAAGRFLGSGGLQLAVLHPRKLSVYGLASQGGGSYLHLSRLYEHWLEHTAANMTYGPFGGVQGCDYICVQSYDGQLYFFEAEGQAFTRYLPSFLVPGPLAYIDVSDTFVTATAALELEAYKYKVIAAASSEKATPAAKELSSPNGLPGANATSPGTKRMQADWRVVLGEAAIDIRVGRFSQGLNPHQADLIVLGEHTLFVLSSTGQITFQKRLEYHPACCTTYPVPGAKTPGGPENLLVATHTRALLVYRSSVLTWAAKADLQPVALEVADLPAMRGALVLLGDDGRLAVAYLGTDPLTNPVGFTEGKELDYEAMAREHRALAAIIREHGAGAAGLRALEPHDRLVMRAQIPQRLDAPRGASLGGDGLDELSSLGSVTGAKRLTIRLYLALQGGSGADNLTLTITAPEPLTPVASEIYVPSVSTNPADPTVVLLTIATGSGLPSSPTAMVLATYTSQSGEPRSQRLDLALPLCAFCQVVPPVKNAEFKVTLSTNRAPPPLGSIFEDVLAAAAPGVAQALSGGGAAMGAGAALGLSGGGAGGSSGTASVLSFSYWGGAGDVTILVSKAGGRYRIQSDVLEGLWLIAKELATRLSRYYAAAEAGQPTPPEGPFAVTYEDALPLDDFFDVAEQHFAARQRVADLRSKLEDRAVQFRNIEKRLLMRFKDKSPAPLNQLDVLMNETYEGLIDLGNAMEEAQAAVVVAARRLSGCVQLLLLLVGWRFALSEPEAAVLRGCISPEVIDGSEVGWEETTEAACTHLLRTCLAKSAKEQAVPITPLAPCKDTQRLRKHVSLVLERLARGMRLMTQAEVAAAVTAAAAPPPPPPASPAPPPSGLPAGPSGRPLYREQSAGRSVEVEGGAEAAAAVAVGAAAGAMAAMVMTEEEDGALMLGAGAAATVVVNDGDGADNVDPDGGAADGRNQAAYEGGYEGAGYDAGYGSTGYDGGAQAEAYGDSAAAGYGMAAGYDAGGGTYDASGAGTYDPSGGGMYDPAGGGAYDPSGSGVYAASAAGAYDPSAGGVYNQSGSGAYSPSGGGMYDPNGGGAYSPSGGAYSPSGGAGYNPSGYYQGNGM